MKIQLIGGIGMFLFGWVAGANLSPDVVDEPLPDNNTLPNQTRGQSTPSEPMLNLGLLGELNQKINTEIEARQKLETIVLALQSQLSDIQRSSVNDDNDIEVNMNTTLESVDNISLPDNTSNRNASNRNNAALVALGLDTTRVEEIRNQVEAAEMAQLFLRNEATREGWLNTDRFYQERRELQSDQSIYREELGDNAYDQYLFATGAFNRVGVQSVLASSPAETAGLQTGDMIYSYDNQRIFSWNDLTSATAMGEVNETVKVVVMRNDQVIYIYLPRGPLGIRLSSNSVDPT